MFSGQCIHREGHSPSRVVVRTVTSTSACYYNWVVNSSSRVAEWTTND